MTIIKPKRKRGEDGHRYLSVRVKIETMDALDAIAGQSDRSRNELINIFLEHGIQNYQIIEE